jgi:hypothetical protein
LRETGDTRGHALDMNCDHAEIEKDEQMDDVTKGKLVDGAIVAAKSVGLYQSSLRQTHGGIPESAEI